MQNFTNIVKNSIQSHVVISPSSNNNNNQNRYSTTTREQKQKVSIFDNVYPKELVSSSQPLDDDDTFPAMVYNNTPDDDDDDDDMDETKRFLFDENSQLKHQLEFQSQTINELNRKLAIQQEEHAYQKAKWNDQMLDMHGKFDSILVKEKRLQERNSSRILELELQELSELQEFRNSLLGTETEETKTPPPSTQTKDDDDMGQSEIIQQLQTSYKEKTKQLKEKHLQQRVEWEQHQLSLTTESQQLSQALQEASTRIEWLESELLHACPSDTDDDEGENNSHNDAPCIHVKQLLQQEKKNKEKNDQTVSKFHTELQELKQEFEMTEAMQERQILELQQKNNALLLKVQKNDKHYQDNLVASTKLQQELYAKVEDLELQNFTLTSQLTKLQDSSQRELHTTHKTITALQQELVLAKNHQAQLKRREAVLQSKLSYQLKSSPRRSVSPKRSRSPKRSQSPKRNTTSPGSPKLPPLEEGEEPNDALILQVSSLENQLTQVRGQEALLQQELNNRDKTMQQQKVEIEEMQERMDMLMTYMEN